MDHIAALFCFGMSQMRSVVLRLYDNRARQTSRSPEVYLNKEVYGRDCYTVLDVRDQATIGSTIQLFRDPAFPLNETRDNVAWDAKFIHLQLRGV